MRSWLIFGLVAAVCALSALQMSRAVGRVAESGPAAPTPVKVLSLSGYTPEESPRFAGRVEAGDSAQLAFRVAGQIRKLNVHMGEDVAEGAVLAELDPTDYLLNLEAREAEFEVARLAAERESGRSEPVGEEVARSEETVEGDLVSLLGRGWARAPP